MAEGKKYKKELLFAKIFANTQKNTEQEAPKRMLIVPLLNCGLLILQTLNIMNKHKLNLLKQVDAQLRLSFL